MDTRRKSTQWALLAFLLLTPGLTAQVRVEIALATPMPTVAKMRCSAGHGALDGVWDELNAASALDAEAARATLRALEDSLLVGADQPDVELQYTLAAIVGARAEVEGGLAQMEAAKSALGWARTVLEHDPEHAGAQHIVGRLHLEVLRMSRVKRFLATKVLGGSELSGASWPEARRLLEAGAIGDPCSIDHQFHLARFYAEIGDTDLALERLDALSTRTPRNAREAVVAGRATELRERLATRAGEASR